MLSNKIKATVILGGFFGVLALGALLGWAPYADAAFQPYVDGHRTIYGENQDGKFLVVGGETIWVTAGTPEYVDWLEAQVWDLQAQLNGVRVPECESEEAVRASGIAERIASITAMISALVAR